MTEGGKGGLLEARIVCGARLVCNSFGRITFKLETKFNIHKFARSVRSLGSTAASAAKPGLTLCAWRDLAICSRIVHHHCTRCNLSTLSIRTAIHRRRRLDLSCVFPVLANNGVQFGSVLP